MYNSGKIITGLILFVGLVTLPFWYSIGKSNVKRDPSLNTPVINQMKVKHCIESKQFMVKYWPVVLT